MNHTISSSDVDKSESTGVDFRRFPDNVSLATCRFAIRAAEAFRFFGIAEVEDDEWFQRCNLGVISAISVYKFSFWKLHF